MATREQVQVRTRISSKKQAEQYLLIVRISYSICALLLLATNLATERTVLAIGFLAFLSILWLTILNAFLLGRLKQNQWHAAWTFFFAPWTWFWLYPKVTRPLRIILGKLEPPEHLTTDDEYKELEGYRKQGKQRFWKTLSYIYGIPLALLVLMIGALLVVALVRQP